eukprot:c30404_g1_i1 orf=38-196(+)
MGGSLISQIELVHNSLVVKSFTFICEVDVLVAYIVIFSSLILMQINLYLHWI